MFEYQTRIVLLGTGILGACAGLVGSFAVLRRKALTGDALAHAALPGLCLAFLILGQKSLPAMLVGALVSGLLGIGVIAFLRRQTRIKEDAAIGLVLSVFFGAGIVLDRFIQNYTTEGSQAGVDSYIFGQTAGMLVEDVFLIAGLALLSLLVVLFLYKEFKLVAFDPGFARAQGWPAFTLDLLLMGLLALAVVIGLPAVGVVLMAALLILPAATARFWTDSLSMLLVLSASFGLVIGLVGTLLSAQFSRMPTGPIIVLVGSALFLLSMLLAPRRGLVGRWYAQQRFQTKLAERNLMRILYDLAEPGLPAQTELSLAAIQQAKSWSAREVRRLLQDAERDGLVRTNGSTCVLTEAGLEEAAEVARNQRLWEQFLTTYPEQATTAVDLGEQSLEEALPRVLVEDLLLELEKAGRLPGNGIRRAWEEAAR